MASNIVWAIDVGQTAVRAVKAARAGERIEVLAFDSIPYKEPLASPGVDKDATVQQALRSLVMRNHISNETIAVAISSQSALIRFIKLPPVEKKRIPDIVRYEAHQQIPFPLEEVVWAYKPLEKSYAPGEQVEVGIFAMRRDIVNRFLSNLMVCGIDVDLLQLAPMSLYNFLSFDQPPGSDATMLLDIGAENTELLLTTQNTVWPRSLPISGDDLTEALMDKFKVPFDKAETLKHMAMQSKYSVQIYHAIEPLLKRIVEEVQRSIGFYRSQNPGVRIAKVLALGGSFRLPGLAKYLSENLHLPIQLFETPQNFDIARARNPIVFQQDGLAFGVVLGLAVQALGLGPMDTSLLPAELLQRKMIDKKKPFAAAVAAVVVLAAALGWFSTFQRGQLLADTGRKSYQDLLTKLDAERGSFTKEISAIEPVRKKLGAAEAVWNGRDDLVRILDKLTNVIPPEPNNEQGVWLIKVVTQRIPFDLAAKLLAQDRNDDRRVILDSGLTPGPQGGWADDPVFQSKLRAAQMGLAGGSMQGMGMGGPPPGMGVGGYGGYGMPSMGRSIGLGLTHKPGEQEDVIRVVVVGEVSDKRRERFVEDTFLKPLAEDREFPMFLDATMLSRTPVTRFLDHLDWEASLSQEDAKDWATILSVEGGGAAGTTAQELDRNRFLRDLRNRTGVHPVEFLEFTASFFVDLDGKLAQEVKKLEAERTAKPTGLTGGGLSSPGAPGGYGGTR